MHVFGAFFFLEVMVFHDIEFSGMSLYSSCFVVSCYLIFFYGNTQVHISA